MAPVSRVAGLSLGFLMCTVRVISQGCRERQPLTLSPYFTDSDMHAFCTSAGLKPGCTLPRATHPGLVGSALPSSVAPETSVRFVPARILALRACPVGGAWAMCRY